MVGVGRGKGKTEGGKFVWSGIRDDEEETSEFLSPTTEGLVKYGGDVNL